jgi:hypothetical protein
LRSIDSQAGSNYRGFLYSLVALQTTPITVNFQASLFDVENRCYRTTLVEHRRLDSALGAVNREARRNFVGLTALFIGVWNSVQRLIVLDLKLNEYGDSSKAGRLSSNAVAEALLQALKHFKPVIDTFVPRSDIAHHFDVGWITVKRARCLRCKGAFSSVTFVSSNPLVRIEFKLERHSEHL